MKTIAEYLIVATLALCACLLNAEAGTPQFEFRMASPTPVHSFKKMIAMDGKTVYVSETIEMTNKDIASASAEEVNDGFAVHLILTKEGRKNLHKLTRDNVGKSLASMVDGKVVSAPKIMGPVDSNSIQLVGAINDETRSLVQRVNHSRLANKSLKPTNPAQGDR